MVTAALSGVALVGWILHIEILKRLLPGLPPMKANAALCYLLASLSLMAYTRSAARSPVRRVAAAAAAVIVLVGAATLAEYSFGWRLGIDQLLFGDRALAAAPYPGRPATNAALGFGLVGVALLCWEARIGRWWVTNVLAWLVAALGLLALIGYASDAQSLINFTSNQHIALNSAVAVSVLALGVLLARLDRDELALLASRGPGGMVLRRLLSGAIALPVALATLTLAGRQMGLWSAALGEWVFASTVTILLAGLGWMIARAVHRADAHRSRVEGMMRSIAETASDAIVTVNGAGVITYANPALERMFGIAPGGAIGQPAATLLVESDHPAGRRRLAALLYRRDPAESGGLEELTGLRRDGRAFPIEVSRAVWDADGERLATAIIRDASERRRAERRLHGLLESAPDAIIVANAAGEILLANARAETVFGYTREELIGSPVERLLPAEKHAPHAAMRRAYVANPQPRNGSRPGEFTARRSDGSLFAAEITLNPIHTEDGLFVSAAIRDITERTLAERATAQLAAIVACSAEAVIGLNRHGRIESWNASAERLYGYPASEAIGQPIAIVTLTEDAANTQHLEAALAGGTAAFESEHVRRDGTGVEVAVTISPIRQRGGAVIGASCLVQDVSERKRAERELARLADAAELGTDAVISIDLGARVCHWNAGAERLYGYSAQEAIGHSLYELTAFTDEPDQEIAKMVAGEAVYQVETQRRRKDGAILNVLLTISPWRVDGQVVGVTGIAIDLTDRKRSERAREQALADLHDAQRIAKLGSWTWSPSAETVTWSDQMYEIFGRDRGLGPATGEDFLQYVHPEDRERIATGYRHAFGVGTAFEFDYRIIDAHGVERTLHTLAHADPARPGCYLGTLQDITQQHRAETELRLSEERLRAIFEGAPIGVALLNADRPYRLLRANPALAEMLRVDHPDRLVGRPALTLLDHPQRAAADTQLQRLRDGQDRCLTTEVQLRAPGGEPVWLAVSAAVINASADAAPKHVVLHLQDVTERKHYEHQLRFHAERDPLTGLLNRRAMDEQLDRWAANNHRYGTPVTLMVCDLDNLKLVNDTLGHQAGDVLIIGVARALSERLRDTDVLARMGGDEFALLLPHTDLDQARVIAERLRAAILDLDLAAGPQQLHTSLSIGIAPLGDGLTTDESMVAADLAMYDAKRHGRNRVATARQAASDTTATTAGTQLGWLKRLRTALTHDHFELHAQPITELRTGRVRCLELLLRLREPDGELLMPAAFIPTAERFGVITEIDRWVVREATRILAQDPHDDTTYTINLSGVSVGDPELLSIIEHEIATTGVDPGRLIFEFTETAAMRDLSAAREFTHGLARIGCRSAIDDFGSGFGAFSYLKHLPVHYLKIDGEFIRNLPGSSDDRVLLKAIIDVARGLRKQTIAEYVNSDEALALLRDYGADYAQGFHLGTPEPLTQSTQRRAG